MTDQDIQVVGNIIPSLTNVNRLLCSFRQEKVQLPWVWVEGHKYKNMVGGDEEMDTDSEWPVQPNVWQ